MTEEELLVELRKPHTELRRALGSVSDWTICRRVQTTLVSISTVDPETVWKMVAKGLLFVGKSDSLDFVLLSTPSNEQKWKKLQKIAREIARLSSDDFVMSFPVDKEDNKSETVALLVSAWYSLQQHGLDKWLLEGTSVVREKETW